MPDSVPASIRRCSRPSSVSTSRPRRASLASSTDARSRTHPVLAGRTRATAPHGCRRTGRRRAPRLGRHSPSRLLGVPSRRRHRPARPPSPSERHARVLPRSMSRTCRGSPAACPRTWCTATRSSRSRRCFGASAGAPRSRCTCGMRRAPSPVRAPLPKHVPHTTSRWSCSSWRTPNAASVNDRDQQRRQVLASTGARRPATPSSARRRTRLRRTCRRCPGCR